MIGPDESFSVRTAIRVYVVTIYRILAGNFCMVQIFVYFVQVFRVIKANNAHKPGERSSDELLHGCGLAALAYEIYSVGFLVRYKKISRY